MQLISISALSAFVIATAGSVQAIPAHDVNNIVQRASSHHRAVARDVRAAKARAAAGAPVPPTLKKRASNEKRCRVRSTTSTAIANATSPAATATASGAVDNHHHSPSSSQNTPAPAATTPSGNYSSSWQLTQSRQGNSFFDNWQFWNLPDPTNGNVQFVDSGTAWNDNLVAITNGQAIMRANTDNNVGNRQSIRITDSYTFNDNTLILMDAAHMPTGCGTWPAFWANGPNWPSGGEIDIVEGVNGQTQNQGTLHTDPGCTAGTDNTQAASGQLTNADCGSSDNSNTGCGFTDTTNDNSFGAGFNSNGGGVYAMQWVDSGISMWFFPRTAIPGDITAGQPEPSTWPAPFGFWPASSCPPNQYFNNNNAIFDLTFCGDWAGSAWGSSGCADSTGYSSCSDYVSAVGSGFTEAYWAINYVKYFSQ
jgi:hypothetical protein